MRDIDDKIASELRLSAALNRPPVGLEAMIALRDEERANMQHAFELMRKWEAMENPQRIHWPERRCRECDRRIGGRDWGLCPACRTDQELL